MPNHTLVIVESPAKCGKIESFLGQGYKCIASFGHLREIKSLEAINTTTFEPSYTIIDDSRKQRQVEVLQTAIAIADEVILATDDDREGEAIAWHICKLYDLPIATTKRIVFHEITEPAVLNALQHYRYIDMNIVQAQQARQILDLLVGFKVSPLLWKYISRTSENSLSAGRCQTPALRLIYENQQDINKSPGQQVYNVTGYFTNQCIPFVLNTQFEKDTDVYAFLEESFNFDHIFSCSSPKKVVKPQPEPFITSRLQQTASNILHFSPKETMKVCQGLYEKGYITYMRTDSKKYSKEFIELAKRYITANYSSEYISADIDSLIVGSVTKPVKPVKPVKKTKDNNTLANTLAQEAHEAIRPTNINLREIEDNSVDSKEMRLYKLIWENTVQSCMSAATCNSITASITTYIPNTIYTYSSEIVVFPGWYIVTEKKTKENPEYQYLLSIKQNAATLYKKITANITLKNLKSHHTEAHLVQLLEDKGIGRPSTFASLIDKIQTRGYVVKQNISGKKITCKDYELEGDEISEIITTREFGNEKGKLVIQPVGILVMEFLDAHFNALFNYDYTSKMETELDKVSKGESDGHALCSQCFEEIGALSQELKSTDRKEIKIDETHTYIIGKYGPTIKCVNGQDITFKSIRADVDLERLARGEYRLEEIVEHSSNKIGKYQGQDLIIKKGKYGLYATWGENSKSLSCFGNRPIENIPLIDVITELDKVADANIFDVTSSKHSSQNVNIIREITNNISIRNGKFGAYIFHKTSSMKKPAFYKLNGCKLNYNTCDKKELVDWIYNTHKIR